ncbi:hypothetical protein ACLESO_10910 [Pyxidicoccus sp. 3LG]
MARITASTFTGPFRRAVRVRGANARVELEDARFSGPVSAVGVDGGHAEVRRAEAEGGRGSAFSVVEGSMLLHHVRVTGHEFGLSAMRARSLDVRDFTSVRAERAGLGLAQSRGVLEDVVVRDSGAFGGIQLVGGDMEVRRFTVEGAAEYGLTALQGKLRVRGGTVTRVSSKGGDGDGLHLRQVDADVEGVVVRDASGGVRAGRAGRARGATRRGAGGLPARGHLGGRAREGGGHGRGGPWRRDGAGGHGRR